LLEKRKYTSRSGDIVLSLPQDTDEDTQEMRMKVVRIIFFCLIVFLALPEFVLGGPSLVNGIRAHGDVWSVRHDYFSDAAITLIAGSLAIGFAAWGAFWPGRLNWLRFLAATCIVLFMAESIPSWYMNPPQRAASSVRSKMRELQVGAEDWAQTHDRFPMSVANLTPAMLGPVFGGALSPYRRGGKDLPYEFAFDRNATGPALRAERPGVVYYNVAPDGKHFWISATALTKSVGNEVAMVSEGSSGPAYVLTGELQPPAVPASSKPAAKRK
jgi:hypothetical protein